MTTAYLAPDGFTHDLIVELGEVEAVHGRLVIAPGPRRPVAWAHNIWVDPITLSVASISDAAAKLRELQRNWALYPYQHFRRAQLIADRLPHVSAKALRFPSDPAPTSPLGSWTLLARDRLLAAPTCTSAFPNGEVRFVENRQDPPNRAYLKLWEAFTIAGVRPGPGDRCLDLGAAPGGWSWVAASLGAEVMAVDKAPLAESVQRMPGVRVLRGSAFALDPQSVGSVDWLLSDVICYPERLLRLVERWLSAGTVRNFVCTMKFQGETDHQAARQLTEIPGSRLVHLCHNKHELTWMCLAASQRNGHDPDSLLKT